MSRTIDHKNEGTVKNDTCARELEDTYRKLKSYINRKSISFFIVIYTHTIYLPLLACTYICTAK